MITSAISRSAMSVGAVPNYVYLLFSPVEMKNRYPVDTCVYCY